MILGWSVQRRAASNELKKGNYKMEVFDFAIRMEQDGETYYREQAGKFHGGLNNILLMLAEDEKRHAEILKSKAEGQAYLLVDSQTLKNARNVFVGLGDFKSEIQKVPSQLEVYEMALEMEKKSVALYQDYLAKSEDTSAKEVFTYLIQQEQDHLAVLDDLVQAVRNVDSWVESAEFGIRKEY
jgi:rubrerythrin